MKNTLLRLAALITLAAPVASAAPVQAAARLDTLVVAGGCFWGVQAVFQHVNGVVAATSGYAGGTKATPSYDDVSTGTTGHAESVRVVYDPSKVSMQKLLDVFFTVAHDPTQLNRQGPDHGTQYRSAIFYKGDAQKAAVSAYIDQLARSGTIRGKIVTQVAPLSQFYVAEAYHQDYATLHPEQPYIVYNDAPKVAALKQHYASLWSEKKAGY
jgi:peptide-methionine (S)-S-oxide reductase